MKPNGVIHYDFNFFGLTLPLQKLAFVPRFSSKLNLVMWAFFSSAIEDWSLAQRRASVTVSDVQASGGALTHQENRHGYIALHVSGATFKDRLEFRSSDLLEAVGLRYSVCLTQCLHAQKTQSRSQI